MIKSIAHRRVLLPILLLLTVAVVAASADAEPKTDRDGQTVVADIRSGKAQKVPTAKNREVTYAGVWRGCKFVTLKYHNGTYKFPDGEVVEVSENPDPLPPKDKLDKDGKDCVDREPTEAEINAMRAEINARNAPARPPGAPPFDLDAERAKERRAS